MVIGDPTDKGEDASRRKAQNAAAAIEDHLFGFTSKPDPELDLVLDPGQFDMSEDIGDRICTDRIMCRAAGHGTSSRADDSGNVRDLDLRRCLAELSPAGTALQELDSFKLYKLRA